MPPWLYAAVCVAAPIAWALLVSRLLTYLEARSERRSGPPPSSPPSGLPPPDYSI